MRAFRTRGVLVALGMVLAGAALMVWAGLAQAASASLAWNANVEPDLAGYKVYFGTATGVYGAPVDVGNVTAYSLPGLVEGDWFFAVSAYDASGNESPKSGEVSVRVDFTAPAAPTGLRVVGTAP